ncbi:hypothetical protein GCM10028796_17450 [Ramlibacter monticola]|uniref:Uncharacterized protein n=1 Tax=Ramlibacter monticola TaxID=1926872 RepID=A0A937CRZ4_9BURK|nr:hypothetical protein [Ramlibacter monticola]MBL0390571.1 hypothetical protein [Ramlibacter monticola]
MTYHLISISVRKSPRDRAYNVRQSFDAESLAHACQRHVAFMAERLSPRCSVLRDGTSGARCSLEESQHIAKAGGAA